MGKGVWRCCLLFVLLMYIPESVDTTKPSTQQMSVWRAPNRPYSAFDMSIFRPDIYPAPWTFAPAYPMPWQAGRKYFGADEYFTSVEETCEITASERSLRRSKECDYPYTFLIQLV